MACIKISVDRKLEVTLHYLIAMLKSGQSSIMLRRLIMMVAATAIRLSGRGT